MADVNLTVSADIGDLRKQLEQIPGITADQARLMVAELDRGFKKAEKAALAAAKATKAGMKQAEDATRKAADAGKELGDRFGGVGSGAGKMAGALDMLAPGLGSIGQGMADLADVGEVAASSFGSIAAPAIGILAAAALVARYFFLARGGAQHLGGAELHQNRPLGVHGIAARQADRPHLVCGTAAAALIVVHGIFPG